MGGGLQPLHIRKRRRSAGGALKVPGYEKVPPWTDPGGGEDLTVEEEKRRVVSDHRLETLGGPERRGRLRDTCRFGPRGGGNCQEKAARGCARSRPEQPSADREGKKIPSPPHARPGRVFGKHRRENIPETTPLEDREKKEGGNSSTLLAKLHLMAVEEKNKRPLRSCMQGMKKVWERAGGLARVCEPGERAKARLGSYTSECWEH